MTFEAPKVEFIKIASSDVVVASTIGSGTECVGDKAVAQKFFE